MSSDIFDLDEEREELRAEQGAGPSQSVVQASLATSPAHPTPSAPLRVTTTANPNLLSPQPQAFAPPALPQHRKHAGSFAATPSFPSPLAQAITVPPHSDTSSSSGSEGEEEKSERSKRSSAGSKGSGTTRKGFEPLDARPRTTSPKGKESSTNPTRPISPARPGTVGPGSLLTKTRRPDATHILAPISTASPAASPRTSPTSRKSSPTQSRVSNQPAREVPSAGSVRDRRRSGSHSSSLNVPMSTSQAGSSPLAFGSPDLFPVDDETQHRSSRGSTGSPQDSSRDSPNILGLGLGGNWDAASNASGSSRSGSLKGKSKEAPSPRRERDRSSIGAMPISSPPRQRRPSEFLNPSSLDIRKMPVMGGRNSGAVSTLSSSASMISPLNPLPSPWASGTDASSAFSPASVVSDTSAPSSGGAIRLNRVPTSVRLAAELIKQPPAPASPQTHPLALHHNTPSSSGSTAGTGLGTPNATPNDGSDSTSAARDLSATSAMPPPSLPHAKPPFNIGKGRPTLSVPATPSSTRNSSYVDKSPNESTERAPARRIPSSGSLAPPTSFKPPPGQVPKTRPSAPPLTESSPGVKPLSAQIKTHRYRTSMHEASLKSGMARTTSANWPAPPQAQTTPSTATQPGLGLGLDMPQTAIRLTEEQPVVANQDPGSPRMRSVTGQGYDMDLAGVGGMGDAASHASMIMQSRQAKLQRWRPTSSGTSGGQSGQEQRPVPPSFNRSTTTGSPAMLAAPRDIRQASWGLPPRSGLATAASSPGEDLPPVPMTMPFVSVAHTEENESHPSAVHPQSYYDQTTSGPSTFSVMGGQAMGRTGSATGQIGGVEWIDWMDEYKRYKAAKIRADTEAAKLKAQAEMPPPPVPSVTGSAASSSPVVRPTADHSPRDMADAELSSAIDLTPSMSREEFEGHARKRSMSIRSQLSALDPTRSPNARRMSIFERPRQSSNGSAKSEVASSSSGAKKKKNLVNKMEGWWNAVKSNFTPETTVPHQVHRPSNLGVYAERRGPSAPASRRSSGKSAKEPQTPAPAMMRRDTSHSLRNATSVAELRSPTTATGPPKLEDPANITASVSGDIVNIARSSSMLTVPSGMSAYSTSDRSTILRKETLPVPKAGLETRRRQPGLRLELEPHVLSQPQPRQKGHSSNGSVSALPAHLSTVASSASASHRPSESTSRCSSYANSIGPGLTPGVQPWEQTPSPIFALTTGQSSDGKSHPSTASGNDITVASVRRHVKHRLNGAKETCDNTLHKVIASITRFADDTRAQDDAILEEKRRLDEQRDYFENISDSPLMDEESDFDGVDGLRSRNGKPDPSVITERSVSSSRGPSRRASISRPSVTSSPTRRASILPASPNRPTRRRPSALPRNYVGRDRINRASGLALDRTRSGTSSRSTSRSHSPMPMFPRTLPAMADTEEDVEADRQFLASLQELIVIATDVLESSVNSLLSKPSACTEIIQKLQRVGQNWDEHDDWPGRNWYVEILMAIAGLRRVLDWWEAEKGFWAFEDDDDHEPLLFVLKPKEESKFDQEFKAHIDRPMLLSPSQSATAVRVEAPSPDDDAPTTSQTVHPDVGSDTPDANQVEDLKFLAEHAKMVNIVMELGLQGEEIQYVNDAIMEVTGQDPDEVLGLPINELLAPADANVFAEATQKLLEDDNNTVQMRVRIEVQDLDNDTKGEHQPGPVYVEVEGVGMLMRENNEPSHTMWVLKPVTATCRDIESTAPPDASFPVERIMSNEGILCRICEREIVSWFFEKHNETCDAVHRLEAEVSDCNECIRDLCHTFVKLRGEAETHAATESHNPQGLVFYSIPECLADNSMAPLGPQGVEIRNISVDQLEDTIDMLKAAEQIETPIVREDEADLEFNVQRYLPRDSEDRLITVSRWQRPQDVDRALLVLYNHVEDQLRRKHKAIARMQSTIRYSEKTRHEWEDKVNRLLEEMSDTDQSGSDSEETGITPPVVENAPDISPPNQRKIAPQARIPITQGHPHRPSTARASTAHGAKAPFGQPRFGATANRPTTSHGQVTVPRPKIESAPPSAVLIAPPRPDQPKRSRSSHSKPSSPLMIPTDRMSHGRRVSTSRALMSAPLSPRIPSAAQPRANPPSIKDFEIIKPISRGAFGSVYLAKKVATGDYFAIKALKKSDMIAKNQITNVKAERTILMNQSSSPYVTKLFFSFQSKDYLYLVMEYLNGGDCASLVKTLGGLPEEWTRNYIAEVVLGLEYLHARNIVHRDIKPDNLLIDSRGHLKLTDFGLSKIGLLNRQVGGPRPAYLRGTSLRTSRRPPASSRALTQRTMSSSSNDSPIMSPELMPHPGPSSLGQSYFSHNDMGSADESSGSESVGGVTDIMRQMSLANKGTSDMGTPSVTGDGTKGVPRFVGTPDYLAPESILGIGTDDRMVDWWALGVVLYEFIYGFPPFHAETPEKVFDNVVSRRIDWHDEEIEISAEARDLMDRLMCYDPMQRLGARGAGEVRQHAFFAGIEWSTVATSEASFVPEVTDPESTDYFDARGAMNAFQDEEAVPQVLKHKKAAADDMSAIVDDIAAQDDFGAFEFRNLPVLKQANDDVIRKLRTDSMTTMGQAWDQGTNMRDRGRSASASAKVKKSSGRKLSDLTQPPSPATSASSLASTPSRPTTPSTGSAPLAVQQNHGRRPSELKALDRLKQDDSDLTRRNSAPSRVRSGVESRTMSGSGPSPSMELWRQRRQASMNTEISSTSAKESDETAFSEAGSDSPLRRGSDRALDVLIAEDNPISQKILETLLTRMGCRCICVEDGPQALASTMGSIRFDVIICDIHMPVVSGEQVARMIRSTNNHNQNTPIIAATSYEQSEVITEEGTLFSAVLNKPVTKAVLVKTLAKLGFELSSGGGDDSTAKSSTPTTNAST